MKKFFEYYDKIIRVLLISTTAGFTAICMTQVFVRYVLGSSIIWAQELCNLLFYIAIFLGAAVCVTERKHITIDIILLHLPMPVLRWWMMGIYLLELAFAAFLVIYGSQLSFEAAVQFSSTLNLSFRYIYMAIPISGIIMAINIVRVAVQDFTINLNPDNTGDPKDKGGYDL